MKRSVHGTRVLHFWMLADPEVETILNLTPPTAHAAIVGGALAAVVVAWLVCHRLVHSRIGRAFVALRENEPLAESVGISLGELLARTAGSRSLSCSSPSGPP